MTEYAESICEKGGFTVKLFNAFGAGLGFFLAGITCYANVSRTVMYLWLLLGVANMYFVVKGE